MPFGDDYRGGVSLATGWLAGSLGGAERIVVSQLAEGTVKVYSSGSALDGGPAMYLHSPQHGHGAAFREIASFTPFDGAWGTQVATTSTTSGANLLVSGVAQGAGARVLNTIWSERTTVATAGSRTPRSNPRRNRAAAGGHRRRLSKTSNEPRRGYGISQLLPSQAMTPFEQRDHVGGEGREQGLALLGGRVVRVADVAGHACGPS